MNTAVPAASVGTVDTMGIVDFLDRQVRAVPQDPAVRDPQDLLPKHRAKVCSSALNKKPAPKISKTTTIFSASA
ncbi:MAG: hypothetical protein ACREMY_05420 [bacterium]